MTDRLYTESCSFSPWSAAAPTLPGAKLLHYDDGATIPIIALDEAHRWTINLGALPPAEAVVYLRHMADSCERLARELVQRSRRGDPV